MDNSAAILLMTCDAYSDLWNDFFELKKRMWPDCTYNTYIATESKEAPENADVCSIKCGNNTEWTERLRIALKTIEEHFVILMLDDFYISKPVNNDVLDEDLKIMCNGQYKYFKLDERFNLPGEKLPDNHAIKKILHGCRYGVSLLTSIWDKQYLLDLIEGQNISAWEFELLRNQENDRTMTDTQTFLYDTRNPLNIIHMVERGKYMKRSVIQLKRRGYEISNSGRGYISYINCLTTRAKELSHNVEPLRKFIIQLMHVCGKKTVSEKYKDKYHVS